MCVFIPVYLCSRTTIGVLEHRLYTFCLSASGPGVHNGGNCYICVHIQLHMCPHTTLCVPAYYYMCVYLVLYVSTYYSVS